MKRKRKSPVRHHVRSHIRNRSRVTSYARGRGTATALITKRRVVGKPKSFTVNFKYSNRKGDGESVVVIATSYDKALDEAFEEKTDQRQPIEIEIIDPNIGKALRILAKGAGKAVTLGAKYTYVAGKTVAKEAAFAIARAYRSQKLRRLIEECYSPDQATKAMARAKLRTQYPEIYSVCDFSKERISAPATKQKWVRRTKAYY